MHKPLIAVDCDLTVCPSDIGWWRYLYVKSISEYETFPYFDMCTATKPYHYNLGEYYNNYSDCYDYWRELDYSQFTPIKGSVEKLEALSEDFGIVFISAAKGSHGKSKYYWLEEHFPFSAGVMLTKEKYLMDKSVVAMIDDRMDMLEKFQSKKRVWYKTPYTQSVDVPVAMTVESWDTFDINSFCGRYL